MTDAPAELSPDATISGSLLDQTSAASLAEMKHRSFVGDGSGKWTPSTNPNYNHDLWYSNPNGSFERRLAQPSVMDTFSGFNYNKVPNQPGEYYSPDPVKVLDVEWDEEEYYRNWKPTKSKDQLAEELNKPKEALFKKYDEF